jgi:mannose-6-phosphate isomerase-like protein (cupin superfamily)
MDQIQIVSRNAIPPIQSVEQGGEVHELGELRDFRWNAQLRDFMPAASRFSVSWVRLQHGEVLDPHVHPIQSLMVFYAGAGTMLGDLERPVAKDDVVVVPAGCKHGFVGGPDGLYALSIQLGEGLYTTPQKPRVAFGGGEHTLDTLLAYNQRRIEAFKQRPIFELLADGTLEDPHKRKAYLDALQIWVDGNQALLFSRQASCFDPRYARVFLGHMHEELGHDAMHKDRRDGTAPSSTSNHDAVMEAITNWFTYQMFVLDNAEKAAVIHLVIENASIAYHTAATPVLAKYVNEEYFDVHVENDSEHAALGEQLLCEQSSRTYARLQRIIAEAWDMISTMTDRVVELTRRV